VTGRRLWLEFALKNPKIRDNPLEHLKTLFKK